MRNILTYIVVTLGVALSAAAIYFGSILPLAKSKSYIAAERNLGNVRSVPEFIANFDRSVDLASPVGNEEIPKFLGGKILDVISSLNIPEKDSRVLAEYADKILFDDDVRHLMISGHLWRVMGEKFETRDYVPLAEARFRAAHEIGPKLPTPLYALYLLYARTGDPAAAAEFRATMEALWPEIKNTPEFFEG